MDYLLVASLIAIAVGGVLLWFRARDLQGQVADAKAETDAAEFERTRITQHVEDILVPLTWAWDLGPREGFDGIDRLRVYLVAAYLEAQKALLLDDVEMTEQIIAARVAVPPRRLPRYPQVPPFLAGTPNAPSLGLPTSAVTGFLPQDSADGQSADDAPHAPPTPAQRVEAYRYFTAHLVHGTTVEHDVIEWAEVDRDTWEQAGDDPTVCDRWRVDAFTPSQRLQMPKGVREIIFGASQGEPT